MATLWHGRFEGGPADELLAFTVSLPVRPAPGARRHRRAPAPTSAGLARVGILTDAERDEVLAALDQVEQELADGHVRVRADRRGHPHRRRAPRHRAGRRGRRQAPHRPQPQRPGRHRPAPLHEAGAARRGRAGARACRRCCSTGPWRPATPTCPGYTHLQRAQPVTLAHHLLAHGWALARDVDRLLDCRRRADVSPARRRRAGRLVDPARPRRRGRRPRVRGPVREQPRRGVRPRLRRRGAVRAHAGRRPPLAHRRGARALDDATSSASPASTTPSPPAAR